MTFDEVLDEMNADQEPSESIRFMERLRDIYATTVEMTSEQYRVWNTALERSKKHKGDFIYFIDVLGDESSFQDNVFREKLERFINDSKPLMKAWLHPETIKIVDEDLKEEGE